MTGKKCSFGSSAWHFKHLLPFFQLRIVLIVFMNPEMPFMVERRDTSLPSKCSLPMEAEKQYLDVIA